MKKLSTDSCSKLLFYINVLFLSQKQSYKKTSKKFPLIATETQLTNEIIDHVFLLFAVCLKAFHPGWFGKHEHAW